MLNDWLAEHGIDPDDVHRLEVDGDELVVEEYSRTANGRLRFDPSTRRPLFTRRRVRMTRPLPKE